MSEEKWEEAKLLFLHNDFSAKLKRAWVWVLVTDEEIENETLPPPEAKMMFSGLKGIMAQARPGQIFVVKVSAGEDGVLSISPSTARYHGMWKDKDKVTELAAIDVTYRTQLDLEARRKKDAKVDRLLARLEPLQEAFHRMRGSQRRIFLALVVERIARPPK